MIKAGQLGSHISQIFLSEFKICSSVVFFCVQQIHTNEQALQICFYSLALNANIYK